MSERKEELVRNFIEAFEEVFDRDWSYTKCMLGIRDVTEEQEANARAIGLEDIPVVCEDATFVNPGVDDEIEDWGNRGTLLELYRELKKVYADRPT